MRSTYRVLGTLLAVGVFVQAASIAFALFQVSKEISDGAVIDTNYIDSGSGSAGLGFAIHAIDGQMVIPLIALLLLIVSFFAHVPGGVRLAVAAAVAVAVQVVLAFISFGIPGIGALHGINALVVLGIGINAARIARPRDEVPLPVQSTTPAAAL